MPQRFVSFDGVEISYQEWGRPGSVPPVILHHGFAVDAQTNWVLPGVVDAIASTGRHVIAPDARGHGASEKPTDPARYGEDTMARDLTVLIDRLGVAEADLVGYSMGGVVAAITAATDGRIRRLVIGGVAASLVERGGVDSRVLPQGEVIAVLLADSPTAIAASPAMAFRALADAVGADRRALAAQITAAHRTPIPLHEITADTLVLCGRDDPFAARPEILAAAIPRARLRRIPGDHLGAVRDPAFAAALVDFLTTLTVHTEHPLPAE
ncbi:pimeloyl-ACP methyl ester carboxylesterase [Catenuloplanes nepalensis]|uniref:Pimeloyl-ACP methyl ester carboxylesterase n=1 Tax=Catenuloplanes nepalensis TaxID=587533 RepID=A0ABT9MW29_9ACTN|nr:alpha/beta hydrolase [Catenuloplanes nepalensis]MDP9795589.1 pimeloyl-ACP methyl ester carboxylesterase [Catenuloplanes nepalensis]